MICYSSSFGNLSAMLIFMNRFEIITYLLKIKSVLTCLPLGFSALFPEGRVPRLCPDILPKFILVFSALVEIPALSQIPCKSVCP